MDQVDGLLHHYRSWEKPQLKHQAIRDEDMYRFKDTLLKRLEQVWSHFPALPLDIDVIAKYGVL